MTEALEFVEVQGSTAEGELEKVRNPILVGIVEPAVLRDSGL